MTEPQAEYKSEPDALAEAHRTAAMPPKPNPPHGSRDIISVIRQTNPGEEEYQDTLNYIRNAKSETRKRIQELYALENLLDSAEEKLLDAKYARPA